MQKERLRPLAEAERRESEMLVRAIGERVDRVQRVTALLAVPAGRTLLRRRPLRACLVDLRGRGCWCTVGPDYVSRAPTFGRSKCAS
jgi:hypothetical protein